MYLSVQEFTSFAYDEKVSDNYNFTEHFKQIAKLSNYLGAIHLHYFFDNKIAYAYNNLGDAFFLTGNVLLALRYGQTSLDLFEELMAISRLPIPYSKKNHIPKLSL